MGAALDDDDGLRRHFALQAQRGFGRIGQTRKRGRLHLVEEGAMTAFQPAERPGLLVSVQPSSGHPVSSATAISWASAQSKSAS